MHCAPRNPTGFSERTVAEDETPFERAARHVERKTGLPRDIWMGGLGRNPANERHYRLMCRLGKVNVNKEPRQQGMRAA